MFIVLFADDILLIAPSVCMLDKLLKICEHKLDLLDMIINVKNLFCLRIGPRNNFSCSPISTSKGSVLPRVREISYLGIKCNPQISNARLIMPRDLFLDRLMLYLAELGHWRYYFTANKHQMYSYFTVWFRSLSANQVRSFITCLCSKPFMKLFKTSNIDAVKCCQDHFGFDLPGVSRSKRVKKFEAKFHACNNLLSKITHFNNGICNFPCTVACSNNNLFTLVNIWLILFVRCLII